MFADQQPREFSYVYSKDNYPLELKGNMKKKYVKNAKPAQSITYGQSK